MKNLGRRLPRFLVLTAIAVCLVSIITKPRRAAAEGPDKVNRDGHPKDEKASLIESALFTRTEFFGAQALVPYPTAEARNRLADVREKYPDDPQVCLKLSHLDEKLGRLEQAEKEMRSYVELQRNSLEALEALASFSHRRAEFDKEAATLERMIAIAPPHERAQILQRLVDLARVHRLENYLRPDFYRQVVAQDPSAFEVMEQYIDKLVEEKSDTEALTALRQYRNQFPDRQTYFIKKEASLLAAAGEEKEAEKLYREAFDPFWPKDLSDDFYSFLQEHNRFRAYGHELREAFRRNPADFDVAVRLLHYLKRSGRESPEIFVQLEKARAARAIQWKPEELVTAARLMIANGNGDAASRFLYTLYVRGGLKPGSPLRAKVLYQLFELLSDAGEERLALTKGDLKFYQDVATADPHPGMLGGVLSLIFSDTDPKSEFEGEEETAVKHFNRAAAYRIFAAYKQEYPTSPELAQMYLDIVRLYTATGEPDVAGETLAEFEKRYRDAPQYPEVALKLADCYAATGRHGEERALYRHIMDYLGERRRPGSVLVPGSLQPSANPGGQNGTLNVYSEPTEIAPSPVEYLLNPGINIQDDGDGETDEAVGYSGYARSPYQDYLPAVGGQMTTSGERQESGVTYATVLERCVASLAKEKLTGDILALYSAEIKKYPDEQGLYEQLLQWLGQTNLAEEQLRVYQETLRQFPTMLWRDRMARWFLRHERKQEFEAFSRELLGKLNDHEVEAYLTRFISSDVNASASSFDASLYLGLYSYAHERFPHNLNFVRGLLRFYSAHDQWQAWRNLTAEYYFESREIRDQFLSHLASRRELRDHLNHARAVCGANARPDAPVPVALPYKLFRADAAAWLSNVEEAIDAYRELNRLYPSTPEFSDRLITFTRSFGQHNRRFLEEAGAASHALADSFPASAEYRTRAGEIQAELGDYGRARGEWEQLITLGRGEPETYLNAATIYWDYFQYRDALRTINQLRQEMHDQTLYAYQAGAIFEAQHRMREALAEYTRALDEDGADYSRAKRRLRTLARRRGVAEQLDLAFEKERQSRSDASPLILGYAGFLTDTGRWESASTLLRREVAQSSSRKFLDRAREVFAEAEDTKGEQAALKRLVEVSTSPRFAISYRLQLAEAFNKESNRGAVASILDDLVRKFPTNYGVLSEAADFYWRIGARDRSLRVLQAGMRRGKGRFHYIFARKLAARETEMNRTAAAERVLRQLHTEDELNKEVLHELAGIYVRTSNREALEKIFNETLRAIKEQDLDIKEMHAEIAELRKQMIDAFTRLKDYRAAIAQHIEIINREPNDEENIDAAITYAKRYGGADELLDYYRRTSQEAYKNYRWNVVLARIYEAKKDLASAAQNYRLAIENQPEMIELYDALAGLCTRMKEYDAALEALNRAVELSNDDPQYIKRMVEVLEKAGRHREAEIARQKLPAPVPKKESAGDQFAEAARLRAGERAQAIQTYRRAFDAFLSDPYKHDLRAAEITGYVQTVRDEENLDQIMQRLWGLRDKLIHEAERKNSLQAGKARSLLETLDGAIPEAVGGVAAEKGTGDELAALFRDLRDRIEAAAGKEDQYGTLALLQNLSRRAGFGSLEEKILVAQKEAALSSGNTILYHTRLRALSNLYSERGDYRHVIALLEAERARDRDRADFEYLRVIAENARLVGDAEKELQSLRENYRQLRGNLADQTDPVVERYFEALYENGVQGREELRSCAEHPSPYQLQLINFLLAKGERELAHEAIENAPLPVAWKLARNAEASLALREFGARNESYFVDSLRFKSIGELVGQRPDTARQVVGDDWFRLAESYGQWLYLSGNRDERAKTGALLPAMIENRPLDGNEQSRLGRWYLEQQDPQRAVEHLLLALEIKPDDKRGVADLGSTYFLLGDRRKAEEQWSQIISGDLASPQDCELYLRTLVKHDLATEARGRLFPVVVKHLARADDDDGYNYATRNGKELENVKPLIRALAASFVRRAQGPGREDPPAQEAEAARAAFFRRLCEALPKNVLLPEMLLRESLVAENQFEPFYRLLVQRSSASGSYSRDYNFTSLLHDSWGAAEAEEALDHENSYKISEPDGKRIKWEKECLDYLIARGRNSEARKLISSIETEINRRYARPTWLRLGLLRLEIRAGKIAQASNGLRHFAGIEAGPNRTKIKPPSTERLSEAVAMLRSEGHDVEADLLLESGYERALALEQYDQPYFVGLARIAFAKGDPALGRKILGLMVDLGNDETKPAAAAELSSLPWIKAYAVEEAKYETPEPHNSISYNRALTLAAETAGACGQFDAAIDYRQQLLSISPEDETNRIELARLLAENSKSEEAVINLASIIGDRKATRRLRWQAVWLASEIIGQRQELWTSLAERAHAANPVDGEMAAAVKALSLASGGRADEAIRLIGATAVDDPNPYIEFFGALLEKRSKHETGSLNGFVGSLVADREAKVSQAFGFAEDEPRRQLVRLYAGLGQPRAALRISESDPDLRPKGNDKGNDKADAEVESNLGPEEEVGSASEESASGSEGQKPGRERSTYQTLQDRATGRQARSQRELLEILSEAAERIGDFNRAVGFERTRLGLLPTVTEKRAAKLRVERLLALQRENSHGQAPAFKVDQRLIAQR